MSALTDLIYTGSNAVAGLTEGAVNDAIAKHGADTPVAFPDTAYFFPTIYAATGVKVKTPSLKMRLLIFPVQFRILWFLNKQRQIVLINLFLFFIEILPDKATLLPILTNGTLS